MRYTVDADLCVGHGRCWTVASAVYTADDEGFNDLKGQLIAVEPGLADVARRGARNCPEGAIELSED
jgi:ferredoxin